MADNKLFLLDAYALIYRAYYALFRNPRVTSSGMNTSAVFGFVNTLDDLIRKEEPSHLAICFDPPGGHTFRHDIFPDYKANREKQPEDITLAIPYIKRILKAMCIPVVELPGYEADDVIGTLATRAAAEGFMTYMMTSDKDYGQLVRDNIFMYRPALKGHGFEVRGPQQVCERYGIDRPEQVIDLLALEGDASDNIPGCPGVGEKTAVKLICQFESVENMLAHTDEIKGAMRTKVEENREKILLSKNLATIRTDLPIDIKPDDLRRCEPDCEALRNVYSELEFRSFIAKLPAIGVEKHAPRSDDGMGSLFDVEESEPCPASEPVNNYTAEADDVLAAALTASRVGLAMYATGPEAMTAELMGFSLSVEEGRAIYLPAKDIERLRIILMRPELEIVTADFKRDMLLLRRHGLEWRARHYDIALAHYLLQPEKRHTLSDMAAELLQKVTLDADNTSVARKYAAIPDDMVYNLMCQRADLSLQLYAPLRAELRRVEISSELERLEQELAPVLADMEWNGVRIDPTILASRSAALTDRIAEMEQQAYDIVGHRFNISSPSQVGHVLFAELKLDSKVKRTKTGGYSTTEETLEKYRTAHPLVDLILEIRGLRKLLATYINALPALVNPLTGKIHTTFNQTGTATGRLSSQNPNLQNIPIRTDEGREIRRAFIADPGCLLLSADYSQIELRLMADISGDPAMIDAFAHGHDIHRATAAKIYHEALDDVTDTQRRNAKTANFGIIYGISAFGLSERLKIPRSEAKQLIDGYFASYPAVKQYMTDTVEQARDRGYVTTVMGRRRMLPDITSRNAVVRGYAERNAINAPLQGSAADIIKKAMVDIAARIRERGLSSTMIIQVHDELVFNVIPGELSELQSLVISSMKNAYKGRVALEVSAGTARNWLEAH